MFEQFFGLSENPFNVTPDPKYLFLSKAHEEALSYLRYGIDQRKGFVLITGEVGAGKTTICRSLLGSLPRTVRTALVLNPALSDVELLQTINQDFGINAAHTSKKALLDELYEFLITCFINGENAVLIIDECQNLSPDVLEQIRMLSNLETEKEKLLQIVLVGQPELLKLLSSPAMKQIDDRIVLRYHIGALSLWDTRSYINHRLIISGSHGDIRFSPLAFRLIYRYSKGIPRRINAVTERSLLIAYLRTTRRISGRIVANAIRELEGNYPAQYRLKPAFLLSAACMVAIVAVILIRPGILTHVSQLVGAQGIAVEPRMETPVEQALMPPQAPVMAPVREQAIQKKRDFKEWILSDYNVAVDILTQLPETIVGPDAMNLHPQPEFLRYLPMPAIVSVDGGYLVMLKADASFVQVVGKKRAVIEVGIDEFKGLYQWNVMVPYSRPLHETVLKVDSTGEEVEKIQSVLVRLGMLAGEHGGVYDLDTEEAVEKFQEAFGLRRDGIVGPETMVLVRTIGEGRG